MSSTILWVVWCSRSLGWGLGRKENPQRLGELHAEGIGTRPAGFREEWKNITKLQHYLASLAGAVQSIVTIITSSGMHELSIGSPGLCSAPKPTVKQKYSWRINCQKYRTPLKFQRLDKAQQLKHLKCSGWIGRVEGKSVWLS